MANIYTSIHSQHIITSGNIPWGKQNKLKLKALHK